MKDMEIILGRDLNLAVDNWIKACPDEMYYVHRIHSFKQLIPVTDFLSRAYGLVPEQAAMVRGMRGPHGYAYCRMLMVQEPSVEIKEPKYLTGM